MMRKIAAAGVLAAAVGGFLLTAAPAQADSDTDGSDAGFWREPKNVEIIPIQTCRGIDGAGLGGAVHSILAYNPEDGPCINGPVIK